MKEILQYIDIFGSVFNFSTRDRTYYTTYFGGLFTLASFIILTVFIFIIGKDFYHKKNPKIIANTVVPKEFLPPFTLSNHNFSFAWRIIDSDSVPFNFTDILYPVISYSQLNFDVTGGEGITGVEIETKKCNNKNLLVPNELSSINYFDVASFFCLDWSDKKFTFGGGWDGDYVNYFSFSLSICKDGKTYSKDNCADLDKVKQILMGDNNLYLEIFYPKVSFNPNDLDNPMQNYYVYYYLPLNILIQKYDKIYFKNFTLEDDKGWLFESVNTNSFIGSSRIESDFLNID